MLVVEDNSELRHVLREALASEGYQVLAARDETEALELMRETPVDLLIADLNDPRPPDEALRNVRQALPELPMVALSNAAGGHPPLFFSAWTAPPGIHALPKPFRLGELLAVSREVLGPVHGAHWTR